MKKSFILGIATAASFAFAEAAWVKPGSSTGSEQAKSISTLGSLVNERSFSTGASVKAGAETAKASLAGLVNESKAITTRWKDGAGGISGSGSVAVAAWEGVEARIPVIPESSTWASLVLIGVAFAAKVARQKNRV